MPFVFFVLKSIQMKLNLCISGLMAGTILAFTFLLSSVLYASRSQDLAQIQIRSIPLDRFDLSDPLRRHFGALDFRGGLVLTSENKAFGGISALRIQPDGAHFIALSDRSSWLSGRIVYNGPSPAGIAEAVMAPVLDARGRHTNWDTESIAQNDGYLYVGVEGLNSIFRFNYRRNGLLARGEPIAVLPGIKKLPENKGLEAMVFAPRKSSLGGAIIALSERGLTQSGDLRAFIIGGSAQGEFAVRRSNEFDISDAALLPGGDLLILERRFSLLSGIAMRIRRIPLKEIRPGAVVDGPALIEAGMNFQIDNMEALSVNRMASGQIVLTLMSDDNFSPLQRTILLQFALK